MSRCIDCPAEATIQVVSAEGVPVATLCQEDFEAHVQLNDAIMAMLAKACDAVGQDPS
jgi:hypothetical protein